MCADANADGLISEAELAGLTELFCKFEGALDPRSTEVKEAKLAFDQKTSALYQERAFPVHGDGLTSTTFYRLIRVQCRLRASKRPPCA